MEQSEVIKQLETLPVKQYKAGETYAEAKATYKSIDEQKKTMLATIKNEIAFDYAPSKVSETQLEREAIASPRYKQFLFGMNLAYKAFLQAEAKLNAVNAAIDCIRSINSIKKSEHNII